MKSAFSLNPKYFVPVLSGFLLGLSMNEVFGMKVAFLAWFCLVPLFVVLNRNQDLRSWFVISFLFAATFLQFPLLAFIVVNHVAGTALVILTALIYTIPFLLIYQCKKWFFINSPRHFLLLPLIFPMFDWIILEKLTAIPLPPFVISQANYPWIIQYIDITGSTAISFWVVMVNVVLFLGINKKKQWDTLPKFSEIRGYVFTILILFLLPILYGLYSNATIPQSRIGQTKVTVIQPNIEALDEADTTGMRMFDRLVALSDSAIKSENTDLIVWPETAIPISFRHSPNIQHYLADKVLRWQTPLITGTIDMEYFTSSENISPLAKYLNRDYKMFNSVLMLTPQLSWKIRHNEVDARNVKVYRKQYLMPFTEYVPLAETFPSLSKLGVKYGNNIHLSAGTSKPNLRYLSKDGRIVSVSSLICWDIMFTSRASNFDPSKTQFITAHSNESLLGDGLRTTVRGMKNYTRLRSIETRKAIVKSSTTGLSLFVSPFGEVYGEIEWFKPGFHTENVVLMRGATFFSRHPHWFPITSLLAAIMLVIFLKYKS